MVSGKRRFRRNWQFADDGKRTANCSEPTQCEEEHRAAIQHPDKSGPTRTGFVMDWPGRCLADFEAQIETLAR
jgi:hypothetical protein